MKKIVLRATVALAFVFVPLTAALTQEKPIKLKRTPAARTALCQEDCKPRNLRPDGIGVHGLYRSYNEYDPHLTSIQGREDFAQCVKACVDPLPQVYIQKPFLAMGMKWFGQTGDSCYNCHAASKAPAKPASAKRRANP